MKIKNIELEDAVSLIKSWNFHTFTDTEEKYSGFVHLTAFQHGISKKWVTKAVLCVPKPTFYT